jgi:hypothetical protein
MIGIFGKEWHSASVKPRRKITKGTLDRSVQFTVSAKEPEQALGDFDLLPFY